MRREIVYKNGVAVFAQLDPEPGQTAQETAREKTLCDTINAKPEAVAYVAELAAKGEQP